MPMRESQLPFKETHTAQVPCKGSCRRPWRASSAVSRGGAAWSQGGRWLPGYRDFPAAKKHPSGSTRRGVRRKRGPGLKKEKRKRARKHGGERAECDDDALLPKGKRAHQKPPFFSNGLRYSVMMRSMRPMAGKMKFSFPKRRRLPMEEESPMRAV